MRLLKRVGVLVAIVVVLLGLGAGAAYAMSENKFNQVYTFAVKPLTIPKDAATIERGKHLVTGIAQCVDCHGANLQGRVFLDTPGIAKLSSANLTAGKGGVGGQFTDEDWVRALRHGVSPDGKALRFMPSDVYAHMTDDDLAAVIAYVKSVPPVDNVVPTSDFPILGRFLFVAGFTPQLAVEKIDHNAESPVPVASGPTAEYGQYLVSIADCRGCHNPSLSGGKIPGGQPDWPNAQNLTPTGIGTWTQADFIKAMRTGTRPDGTVISTVMPWPYIGQSTDDELKALFAYLQTLPAKPDGVK